jgi:hypothetical protein
MGRFAAVASAVGVFLSRWIDPEQPVTVVGWIATVLGWCALGMLAILGMVAVLFAAGCEVRWPSSFYQREQKGAGMSGMHDPTR